MKAIGLDGCFFKGVVKGELLCAIGRDANNQMYPLAWVVVEQETDGTWKWFVGLLIKDLDINNNGASGCLPLINKSAYSMPCRTIYQLQSIGCVLGTCMLTGGRSTELMIGRKNVGLLPKL